MKDSLTDVNDASAGPTKLCPMASEADISPRRPAAGSALQSLARRAPLPLFPLQPLLGRIVRTVARTRSEIFDRIGPHTGKRFLIDPVNMPFVLLLHPDPARPRLRAARRYDAPAWDSRIAGSFLTLLSVVDGRLDADALFFTRELIVEGDTEAAVCLRNALDDLEGGIADDVAEIFGPPGRATLSLLRHMSEHHQSQYNGR